MQDRVANISTILRGDLLTGSKEKIQELMTSTDEANLKLHGTQNILI
jgi:hypothetical protein